MSSSTVSKSKRRYLAIKRMMDSIAALALLLPCFCIVSLCYIAIKIETKGPAFFVQERPGKHGRLFKIYKLRTMIVETEREGRQLSDMDRMTKVGRIIRKFSLDELPQILNIFKGEMSFIGPRPLLKEYLPMYTKEQARRHEVMPGISGWAQVNGRNKLSWEMKFEYDIWYVDHVSFKQDFMILCLTIMNIIRRQGINVDEGNTMRVFEGSKGTIIQ